MTKNTRRRSLLLGSGVILCAVVGVAWAATPRTGHVPSGNKFAAPAGSSLKAATRAQTGSTATYMIELIDEPAVTTFVNVRKASGTQAAVTAAAAQRSKIETAQQKVSSALAGLPVQVIYKIHRAYNGIAVLATADQAEKLTKIAGVKSVHLVPLAKPTNSVTVPLIRAPDAWQSTGLTGTGVKIGIIDTGIDYLHRDFGGPGLTDAGDTTAANPFYPSAKVVGGFDFAGDAYTGANAPVPDSNPMDCKPSAGGAEGHGSHTSGTAAGYGVTADGGTYSGVYSTATPFAALKIGPGVAPNAQIYALRVFGCTGSTGLVPQAIDWAVDPNNDGNFSDHLDVISMSLGSDFGPPDDPSAVAAERAAALGVVVVAASGNSGDLYYVTSSPGSSSRTIAVAASVDSTDTLDGFGVTAPPPIVGTYSSSNSIAFDWSTHVGVTANLYYPGTDQDGCDVAGFSPAEAANMAGRIVLLDWIVPPATTFACGSAGRVVKAHAAGALGVILVDNVPDLNVAITGDSSIPATITTSDVGAILKANLTAGTVNATLFVNMDKTFINSTKHVIPGNTDTLTTFTSRGPRVGGSALKPDITGPGATVFSAFAGSGSDGISYSGTSMATPHIAGTMSLLHQLHPTWTVEELKALAMNTATHDLFTGQNLTGTPYAQSRIGAGRVDVLNASQSSVVAYSADVPGAVSVSFGSVQVGATMSLTRHVTVSNKGASAAPFTLSYVGYSDIPGVTFSFPNGTSISVPAGQTVDVPVMMSADPSLMTNTIDSTVATTVPTGFGINLPRQWVSEKSGLLVLTPSSGGPLRVPLYVTARPASTMAGAFATALTPAPVVETQIALTGTGLDTSAGARNYPTDMTSLVTPLELQGTSARLVFDPDGGPPPSARADDLQYIGVTTDSPAILDAGQALGTSTIFFGVSTYGPWTTAGGNDVQFQINIDTNLDGVFDYSLVNTVVPGPTGATTDVFFTALQPTDGGAGLFEDFVNHFDAQTLSTGAMNTDVMVLPVLFSDLGMTTATRFNYQVVTVDPYFGTIDTSDTFTFDVANPGIDVTGGTPGIPTYLDLPGDANNIPVNINTAKFIANKSTGVLLLHHFNTDGNRAQIIPMALTPIVPTLAAVTGPATLTINQSGTYSSSFTEPGVAPPWTAAADYAYNGTTFTGTDSAQITTAGPISFSHAFAAAGTYTVALRVTDSTGAVSNIQSTTVTVAAAKKGCGCQSSGVELSGLAFIAVLMIARRKRFGVQ